jgi:DNA-binding transcriptional LysR family regulator
VELRHLRHFLAVADTLNYARAAEKLTMAASPLSRSIQQLEMEIGGPLFSRGTRRVELTALGVALVPQAQKVVADVDGLKRDMTRRVQGHVEIRLGIRSVPDQLISAVVDDVFKVVEPTAGIRIEPMDSAAQTDRVLSGRLTFGLINNRTEDQRLAYLSVMTEKPAIALPDRPLFSKLETVRPSDLADLRLLVQPGVPPRGPALDEIMESVSEVVTMQSEIVGGLAVVIAAGESCCLTVANPDSPWHRYLAKEGVVIRPFAKPWASGATYLAWRIDRDTDDDLGPIIAAARERFAQPLDL